MCVFKIFDKRAKKYVGPAGKLTAFATKSEAFDHIFCVLAPMDAEGDSDDDHLDVHDRQNNIAYHYWMIEGDLTIRALAHLTESLGIHKSAFW